MRVEEITTNQLNWLVAKCEKHSITTEDLRYQQFQYSTDWAQGGPIIEREKVQLDYDGAEGGVWVAVLNATNPDLEQLSTGPTPLIAAMRCFVISKLGEEVEVLDGLS